MSKNINIFDFLPPFLSLYYQGRDISSWEFDISMVLDPAVDVHQNVHLKVNILGSYIHELTYIIYIMRSLIKYLARVTRALFSY